MTPYGWRWQGTDKWWPAMLGDPPTIPGAKWVPLRRCPTDSAATVVAAKGLLALDQAAFERASRPKA